MRQEINLYQAELRPRRVPFPAIHMLAVVVLVALVLAAAQAWSVTRVAPLRARVAQIEGDVAAAETRLATARAQHQPPLPDPALGQQLEARERILVQTRAVAERLERGDYGTTTGLSPLLVALSRQHLEGIWLTAVRVDDGGRAVGLRGRTLLPELVPTYLQRLAQEASFAGKTFDALHIDTLADGLGEVAFEVLSTGMTAETWR